MGLLGLRMQWLDGGMCKSHAHSNVEVHKRNRKDVQILRRNNLWLDSFSQSEMMMDGIKRPRGRPRKDQSTMPDTRPSNAIQTWDLFVQAIDELECDERVKKAIKRILARFEGKRMYVRGDYSKERRLEEVRKLARTYVNPIDLRLVLMGRYKITHLTAYRLIRRALGDE